jgi:sugar/nucleoside kinase (ribokinase family)
MLNSNIAVIGHLCIDSISLPGRPSPFVVMGGSAAYVSLAARHLGATTAIISKVGADFPKAYSWWLEQEGIDLSGLVSLKNARTTRFGLHYSDDLSKRELQLTSKAEPITVEDLPKSMKAKVVHIAPIADEVTYEVVEKLKSNAGIMSFDPQGLVREFDEEGKVRVSSLKDKRILGLVDIYKSSLEEIMAVTELSDLKSAIKGVHDCGVGIVIVTLGADGVAVSVEDNVHHVPAFKSDKFVDPTGAGDVFMGSFLAEYVHGEDCSWCSYVGVAAASIVIEGVGPTTLGDKDEIYRRAHLLSEKEIKHEV